MLNSIVTKAKNFISTPAQANQPAAAASAQKKEDIGEVFLSVHCATMLKYANNLKKVLLLHGYTVFLCDQMGSGDDFRDLISENAAKCSAFIPFINLPWCKSGECQYEFKIALKAHLANSGTPRIIPIVLESLNTVPNLTTRRFPSVNGMLSYTNCKRVSETQLDEELWKQIRDFLTTLQVFPKSLNPPSNPVPIKALPVIGSNVDTSKLLLPKPEAMAAIQATKSLHPNAWYLIVYFSDLKTLSRLCQVCSALYTPAKFQIGGDVKTIAGPNWSKIVGAAVYCAAPTSSMAFNRRDNCFYLASSDTNSIYKVTYTGAEMKHVVGKYAGFSSADGPVEKAEVSSPGDLGFDTDGSLLILERDYSRIRKLSADGMTMTTLVQIDEKTTGSVGSMAVNELNGAICIVATNGIFNVNRDGTVKRIGKEGTGSVDGPIDVAQFNYPNCVTFDENDGTIYVTELYRIRKIADGKVVTIAGGDKSEVWDGKALKASFLCPTHMAIDPVDNSLYIVDRGVIRRLKDGKVSTVAGNPRLSGESIDGNVRRASFHRIMNILVIASVLYIEDNNLIRKLGLDSATTYIDL